VAGGCGVVVVDRQALRRGMKGPLKVKTTCSHKNIFEMKPQKFGFRCLNNE
jgi:hypothetical protein